MTAFYYPSPVRWSLRATLALPLVCLLLYPLTAWNYRQRRLRLKPDAAYWADALMLRLGWWMGEWPRLPAPPARPRMLSALPHDYEALGSLLATQLGEAKRLRDLDIIEAEWMVRAGDPTIEASVLFFARNQIAERRRELTRP